MGNNTYQNDYYKKIGKIIKDYRTKKGISISQLAEGVCSISHISRIESGARCPSSIVLRQLVNKLGVTPAYLFRIIESPHAVEVQNFIDTLFQLLDRDDYYNVNLLINENETRLINNTNAELLLLDLQIIRGFKCISETLLNKKYSWGVEELNKHLMMTYCENADPTDIEFGFMFEIGLFLILDGQPKKAYTHLSNMKKHIVNIRYYHTHAIYVKYYLYLSMACVDLKMIDEAKKNIEIGIQYCKNTNTHYLLRELYYMKSEVYFHQKNYEEYSKWLNNSIVLNDMIKNSETEYFSTFYKDRLDKLDIV